LLSMPPLASWSYQRPIEPDSPEALLTSHFLTARDWV
jgi:coproporphyrinogen III oxidase